MKKVKIINITDRYLLTLRDNDRKTYQKNIEFYNTPVSVGDYIIIPEMVLEEINLFTYGPIIENNDPIDLMTLIHDGVEVHLQRYYG